MDKVKLKEVVENAKDKPNNDLMESRDLLITEFTKTKELIISLTKHLDIIEDYYNIINKEIEKRLI